MIDGRCRKRRETGAEADYGLNRRIDLRFLLATPELERLRSQLEAALNESEK